jgi:hypothetical protein
MKKAIALSLFFSSCTLINAQNNGGQNILWRTVGNSANSSDFIGTVNSQPLIFKTNGIERGRIGGGGEFIIHPNGVTNPIATYMLKVGGSGYFEKDLFVKEYITYLKSLHGPELMSIQLKWIARAVFMEIPEFLVT